MKWFVWMDRIGAPQIYYRNHLQIALGFDIGFIPLKLCLFDSLWSYMLLFLQMILSDISSCA